MLKNFSLASAPIMDFSNVMHKLRMMEGVFKIVKVAGDEWVATKTATSTELQLDFEAAVDHWVMVTCDDEPSKIY
jgi:hypothetical protein